MIKLHWGAGHAVTLGVLTGTCTTLGEPLKNKTGDIFANTYGEPFIAVIESSGAFLLS
jgi:hypothetical protein